MRKEQGRRIAEQNKRDIGRGHYRTANGHVHIGDMVSLAMHGTVLYTPEDLGGLWKRYSHEHEGSPPKIEVVEGKTGGNSLSRPEPTRLS